MKRIVTFFILLLIVSDSIAQNKSEILEFEYEGVMLTGVLNIPADSSPKGIALIVHYC